MQAEQLQAFNATLRRTVRPHILESTAAPRRRHREHAPLAPGGGMRRENRDGPVNWAGHAAYATGDHDNIEEDKLEDERVSQATVQDTDDEPVREPFKSEDHQDDEDDEQAGGAGGHGLLKQYV